MYPAILKSQELTLTIMQLLSAINDYLTNQLKKAYFYNRHEKIAAFLLERNKKTIPYTHEEIASLTGLNRVTITKILNYFRQQGWIDISYHKIMIINHNSLNKVL